MVNDSGGTRAPGDFSLHVKSGGADVAGSPAAGTASGRTYTLAVGTYAVSEDAVAGYLAAISGACAADGTVTLKEGDAQTCTITNSDLAQVGSPQTLPPPVIGKAVNALPKSGTVKIKLPGSSAFVALTEGQQIPLGTIVDATKGRVTIVAAADKNGGTATADFYGGIFKLGQTKGATPITTLKLVEKLSCGKSVKKASAAAKKKKKRHLWGDGKGKFRTDGSYSSATVRGTKWLVEDSCKSTLTKVARGKVAVRDFVKKKTVLVKAGKKYIAAPPRLKHPSTRPGTLDQAAPLLDHRVLARTNGHRDGGRCGRRAGRAGRCDGGGLQRQHDRRPQRHGGVQSPPTARCARRCGRYQRRTRSTCRAATTCSR